MTQLIVRVYASRISNAIYFRIRETAVAIMNACRALWQRIMFLALRPVPHYTRLGLYLQAVIVVTCLFCFQWWPVIPTVAIGFLGVVAAIMAVRADSFSQGEKVVYVLIAFALFIVEMRAVYADRNNHDREQAEARAREIKSFEAIAAEISSAIQQSQQHFDVTMAKSDRMIGLSEENLANITGGDSYAYIAAALGLRPPFQLTVWVKGKHGVHNLSAEIQTMPHAGEVRDNDSIMRQLKSMHSLPLGDGDFLPGITAIGDTVMPGRYTVKVISRNEWISEQLDIAQCSDGQWSEAIKMNGRPGKKENKTWFGRPGCHRPFD